MMDSPHLSLEWKDNNAMKHKIRAPLDPHSNVASMCVHITGANDYDNFVTEAVMHDDLNPFCYACSAPMSPSDGGAPRAAQVTDDKASSISSDRNHADQGQDKWGGDSEWTFANTEGAFDLGTVETKPSTDSEGEDGSSQ
jgi:hypothetical protein